MGSLFLMHRVELKAQLCDGHATHYPVPNAPCGVERLLAAKRLGKDKMFLMHRVELKVKKDLS